MICSEARKLDTPYPMKVDMPYSVIDQNSVKGGFQPERLAQVNRVYVLDFEGLTDEMETDGIVSDGDFLGAIPSYTYIWDPLRRLCHRLIAFNFSGRGQTPKKVTATNLFYLRSMDEGTAVNVPYLLAQYLFRYAEGRKQGAMMSGGQFVLRLTEHFGLLTEERLRGLTVVVYNLPMIDMDELVKLWICDRLGDTWALVARAPEKQQAPQAPSAAPGPRTMPQRIQRLEEEVCGVRESLAEQRVLLGRMSSEQSRLSSWVADNITQLLNQSGESYVRFDGRIMVTSHASYQRRTRRRTEGANTSAAPHTDD
ncbi:hypothetical protein Tco_0425002 [Tanacetum coccineum]